MNSIASHEETFGSFLRRKREEKHITLRKMAENLNISPPYLTAIEKDQRAPLEMDKLLIINEELQLNQDEYRHMLDLVANSRKNIAPDLPDYIRNRDYVSAALRIAKDMDAGKEEWEEFINILLRKKE